MALGLGLGLSGRVLRSGRSGEAAGNSRGGPQSGPETMKDAGLGMAGVPPKFCRDMMYFFLMIYIYIVIYIYNIYMYVCIYIYIYM